MNLAMIIRVAFRALVRNKMRAILTMLGIIIGVSAVIAMVSIGQGAQASVQARSRVSAQTYSSLAPAPRTWLSGSPLLFSTTAEGKRLVLTFSKGIP